MYKEAFANIDGIELKTAPNADFNSNFWLSTILIDEEKLGLNYVDIMNGLQTISVESRPLWKPLHLQPVFESSPAYVDGTAEALFNRGLCLPSGPCVSDTDVQLIIDEIKSMINRKG